MPIKATANELADMAMTRLTAKLRGKPVLTGAWMSGNTNGGSTGRGDLWRLVHAAIKETAMDHGG